MDSCFYGLVQSDHFVDHFHRRVGMAVIDKAAFEAGAASALLSKVNPPF